VSRIRKNIKRIKTLNLGILALPNDQLIKKQIFKEFGPLFTTFECLEEFNIKCHDRRAHNIFEEFGTYIVPIPTVKSLSIMITWCEFPEIFRSMGHFIKNFDSLESIKIICRLVHGQNHMAYLFNQIRRYKNLKRFEFINNHSFATDEVGMQLVGILEDCRLLSHITIDLDLVTFSPRVI